nr:hypothetical protein [uncultured Cohaesibacter sp.]
MALFLYQYLEVSKLGSLIQMAPIALLGRSDWCQVGKALKHHIRSHEMWYSKKDAQTYLNQALALSATGREQDWEIELSDPNRVAEFVEFYNDHDLSKDQKQALMSLIISSFEDAMHQNIFDNTSWQLARKIIMEEFKLHQDVIKQWLGEESNEFLISELLRDCW